MPPPSPTVDVVVPTVGRPSLRVLLEALAGGEGPRPGRIVLVDDRRCRRRPLVTSIPDGLERLVRVLPGGGGPAAARNLGWQACTAEWIAFLDDDVVPHDRWLEDLAADLADADPDVAGVQGRVHVPLPAGRPATDWERNVAGLEQARWATADMAYRRDALEGVGGFDPRFPRAYREDADLGLRIIGAGRRIVRGRRTVDHPVPPAGAWTSVRKQAGNADDPLMRRLHGADWRVRAGAPPGRRPAHVLATVGAVAALAAAVAGRARTAGALAAASAAVTADFAWRRIAPGPRTSREVVTMLVTSVAIPPAATWHWLRGLARSATARPLAAGGQRGLVGPVEAVLVDRDGTLVDDVPYNGDPELVEPLPTVPRALDRLRAAGMPVAVITNQSGVGRGLLRPDQVAAVNRRVEELLGPLHGWFVCPHVPEDGCDCRKPQPGLIAKAAADLGVDPRRCVVIGDIGSDVAAAVAAGASPILVPRPATRPEEVAGAPLVVADLDAAVDHVLGQVGR